MSAMPPDPVPSSASVDKALTLFWRIARDRGATPLKTLLADLNLPRSTRHRLVATLQEFGLITRDSRGVYAVGLPLLEALDGITPAQHLARLSRPVLQDLADLCGATAHLGVLENDMVTYLVKVTGKGAAADAVCTRENAQLEAYCSGIGKVLLGGLPAAAREQYLAAGPFVPLTARTITDGDVLRACVRQAARDGFARDDGEVADDLFCLAVPLPGGDAAVDAAISVSFQRSRIANRDLSRDLDRLRRHARYLGHKLGRLGAPLARP
jgi:DNA-binding IclR family transcriptional regulator